MHLIGKRFGEIAKCNLSRKKTTLLALVVLASHQKIRAFSCQQGEKAGTCTASNKMKSTEDLKVQWAGGRDVWPKVPVSSTEFIHVQTKVRTDDDDVDSSNDWPEIVKQSTLFGFGAYNPRGQTFPDDVNEKQHALLKKDIETSMIVYSNVGQFWEGASIWEDGSSEKGFILAFRESHADKGSNLSVTLARKYDQGAIYKFEMEGNRLMRDTIAVLDDGTDAKVEVIMDSSTDLSPFL